MVTTASAAVGVTCLLLANIVSSSAGIGGGSLNISILLVVFGFRFDDSVVFSLCNVCGNYVSQVIVNRDKRHPLSKSRCIIDWFAVAVFVPAQLSGNLVGVLISSAVPSTILAICTIFVLAFACAMTVRNCYKLWTLDVVLNELLSSLRNRPLLPFGQPLDEREQASATVVNPSEPETSFRSENLRLDAYLNKKTVPVGHQDADGIEMRSSDDNDPNHPVIISDDRVRLRSNPNPSTTGLFDHRRLSDFSLTDEENFNNNVVHDYKIFTALTLLWSSYAIIFIMMQLLTKTCGKIYYSMLGLSFMPMLFAVQWALRHVGRQQMLDSTIVLKGDIDFSKFGVGPILLVFAIGIVSALLGLGGGELTGPLMLYLGLLPIVASSTTSAISFMSSSSNVLHYALRREVNGLWGLVFFCIGIGGGYCGRKLLLYLIRLYKRTSITTLALSIVLFLSMWVVVFKVVTSQKSYTFLPFCVN
jgi:uncharacterized membrane protein YfcA